MGKNGGCSNKKDTPEEGPLTLQKKLLTAIEDYWRSVEEELIANYECKMGLTKDNFEVLLADLSKKYEIKEPCIQVEEILECYKKARETGYSTTRCEHFIDKFTECFNEFKDEKINKLASGKTAEKA